MKLRRMCSFLLLLLLFAIAIPILAFAETGEMAVQEIPVSNTPIKGTIEINKWGFVLKGFSESRDTLGYTVHTPLYQDDWLPGAVYEVRAAEDIVGKEQTVWFKKGELAASLTTTADGSVVTEPLPLGRYTVTEVSAPAGYVLDETRHEIALTASDHTTPVVTARLSAVNEHMPARITLTKEKEIVTTQQADDGMVHSRLMNVPGENFVFGLYSSDPIEYAGGTLPADTLIETGITDADGALTFSGDYPHGEYYVQELAGPEGWVLSDARYRVTIADEFADKQHEVVFQVGLPIFPKQVLTSKSSMILKGPKTEDSHRKQYLTTPLLDELRERLARIEENKAFFREEYRDYGLLICQTDGRPVDPKNLEKSFKEHQKRIGIPENERIDFQGLRKSGQMHKVRLSQNNYQLVAENAGQSPEVLMNHYNEALDYEKRALSRLVENSFYPQREMPEEEKSNEDVSALMEQIQKNPELCRKLLQSLTLGAQQRV